MLTGRMRKGPRSRQGALNALLAAFLLMLLVPQAARAPFVAAEEKVIEAVRKVKPSVVNITTLRRSGTSSAGRGIGSGIIFTRDGWILTNAHVLRAANRVIVTFSNGKKMAATTWKTSRDKDIGVVKVPITGLVPAPFGDSDRLVQGQMAIAIGNPLRFHFSVTVGVVSALGRDIKARGLEYTDLIQTDAAINPGSSGGALVNSSAQVVGLNTLVYTGPSSYPHAQGLSFAIPINEALKVARTLARSQELVRMAPWIGVSVKDLTYEMAQIYDYPVKSGALVTSVVGGGPAARAGILPGDAITEFAGHSVKNVAGFRAVFATMRSGTRVSVVVWRRDGKKRTLTLTVEETRQ